MYQVLKNLINEQRMSVSALRERTANFYANGSITFEQKLELDELIYQNATPDAEKLALTELVQSLAARVNALEDAVAALQATLAGGGNPSTEPTEPQIEPWRPWDGVSDKYQFGALVTHNGKTWRNMLGGVQNVWEPGVVDARFWEEVIG